MIWTRFIFSQFSSYHTKVHSIPAAHVCLPAGPGHHGVPEGRAVHLYQGVDAGDGAPGEQLPGGEAPEPGAQVSDGAHLTQGGVVRRAQLLKSIL